MTNKEYNNERLMANVNSLIKEKKVKIGDVENAIGVSPGYLWRLTKKGANAAPSIELVWNLAQYFNIGIDVLLEYDLENKKKTDTDLVSDLLSKLYIETEFGNLEWNKIDTYQINTELNKTFTYYPFITNITKEDDDASFNEIQLSSEYSNFRGANLKIKSITHPEYSACVFGDVYYTNYDKNQRLFATKIMVINKDGQIEGPFNEFYLEFTVSGETIESDYSWATFPLIAGPRCPVIEHEMDKLYEVASKFQSDIRLDDVARKMIQNFMNKK